MLLESTLYGVEDKVEMAVERLRSCEAIALDFDRRGYFVAISGGKDSTVIQHLAQVAGVAREYHHQLTSMDHPETIYFLRREQARMVDLGYSFRIDIPRRRDGRQRTMAYLIRTQGLPSRYHPWCCHKLKEVAGKGRVVVTGVRWEESSRRRHLRSQLEVGRAPATLYEDSNGKRRLMEPCPVKGRVILNPIVDWSEADVWEYIKSRELPYNPLYDQGWTRVGCIGCPKAHDRRFLGLEKYRAIYYRAAKRHLEHRKEIGANMDYPYGDIDEYMQWWERGWCHKQRGNELFIVD